MIGLSASAGLDTIRHGAEILDDEVRWILTKGKLPTSLWVDIVSTAHEVGLRSVSTMMYAMSTRRRWVAAPQCSTRHPGSNRGFTEFVPLPFVHQSSPLYLAGGSPGPIIETTARCMRSRESCCTQEDLSNPDQLGVGAERSQVMLNGGANDLGGTLMEETIADGGSEYWLAKTVAELVAIAEGIGRRRASRQPPIRRWRRSRSSVKPSARNRAESRNRFTFATLEARDPVCPV